MLHTAHIRKSASFYDTTKIRILRWVRIFEIRLSCLKVVMWENPAMLRLNTQMGRRSRKIMIRKDISQGISNIGPLGKCFVLCLCLCGFQEAFSMLDKVVTLEDSTDQYTIGRSIYYFRDHSRQLNLNDVLSGSYDSLFVLHDKDVPSFGNKEAIYWNKFEVVNNASEKTKWLLVIDDHNLDEIDIFYRDSNSVIQHEFSGRHQPFDKRKFKYNNFVVELNAPVGDTTTFYLSVQSFVLIYPLKVMKLEKFIENSHERTRAKGIIIGLFVMIILYNFFIYLSVKDINYLYYTIYATVNIIMICDLTGFMDTVWQGSLSFMVNKTPSIIAIDGIFLMIFSKSILEFDKNFPFANKVIYYFLMPIAAWTITVNILGYNLYASITNQFWVLILVAFLYVAAIVVYRRGYKPARFYIIACGAFFIACAAYAGTLLGYIHVNTFTNHAIEVGSGIEMLLFSFAIGDKLRRLRKEKSETQTQLVNSLRKNEQLLLNQSKILEQKIEERTKDLNIEKLKSENLLLNILPAQIAQELKEFGHSEARLYENVSILFIEFVDFESICDLLSPDELVERVNYYFNAFDQIIREKGLEKIKTFGGAYLAVSDLRNDDQGGSTKMIEACLEIVRFMNSAEEESSKFDITIGIHSGPLVAGIVGLNKFQYDIWGDAVNTAARMQQNSLPGKINVSQSTYEESKEDFSFIYRGKVKVKNKAALDMYFVEETITNTGEDGP